MKWLCCFCFIVLNILNLEAQFSPTFFPKYEFRAVWVASVENIDWPSKKGLSVAEQKAEWKQLLQLYKQAGLNAVIMQIRPVADAFYPSSYEPWSEYLTGKQGKAPEPFYDPLQFMIEETHKQGMEFHAWLNPYRAVFNIYKSSISSTHITKQRPQWFLRYGDKLYFDPGNPEVISFLTNVVQDILVRYDVDGIHMDDYFYPYRIGAKEFPDYRSYALYGKGMSKDAWRRSNCDSIIARIHRVVLNVKPMVKFGISPFGVWRNADKDPDGSPTKAGQTNYDDLYADILLWLKEGWIDYVVPQLYWEIGHPLCDFETLLNWWGEHAYGKQVYIGHAFYRAGTTTAWRNRKELPNQINLVRANKNIHGSVFFSSKSLQENKNGWTDSLQYHYYKYPALIAPMNWVDTIVPQAPILKQYHIVSNQLYVQALKNDSAETEIVKYYAVYVSDNFSVLKNIAPYTIVVAGSTPLFTINIPLQELFPNATNCYIAITAIDKENNESELRSFLHCFKLNGDCVCQLE